MCSIALVGLVGSLASTVVGGIAQQQQSKSQAQAAQQAANYNAQVAANEAETQRNLAMAEMQKGSEERNRVMRAGLANQGEMASAMGASGFTMDSGTNLSLLGQSAEEIQQDASIVSQNANMSAWQRLVGATRAENEGAFATYQGKLAANSSGSKLGLVGTILGGIGQGLSGLSSYQRTATPSGSGLGGLGVAAGRYGSTAMKGRY